MKATVLLITVLAAQAQQRDALTVEISIDAATRAVLNQARAAIPSGHPSRPLLVAIDPSAASIRVADGTLPALPFQAALRRGDLVEIVRVTAATKTVEPPAAQPPQPLSYWTLTVARGRADTTAAAFDAGATFSPLRYDTIEAMLKREVLVSWIAQRREAAVRAAREADTAAAVAAAKEVAAQ